MLKKVNTATKFSTVKTQICGIELGTPHTALQKLSVLWRQELYDV